VLLIKLNHESLKITEIRDEGRDVKTFLFDRDITTLPGKFVLAGTKDGEKPFAISYEKPLGITIKRIEKNPNNPETGKFTNAAFELDEGDRMTITGPIGNGFPTHMFKKGRAYLAGGGTGITSLGLIPEKLKNTSVEIITFLGAKTSEDLIMKDRFHGEVYFVTEDGSEGVRGLITQPLRKYYEEARLDEKIKVKLYCCGPEKMEYNVALVSKDFIDSDDMYFSLERLMRCGQGICGSCVCGDIRICVNGPVLTYSQLKNNPDFGYYKRNRFGIREFL
jgi:dihydroorotate dehydrogenase electron transfer subunit